MNENSKNNLMFKFLEINFPIIKVKLEPKDVNFTRTLLIGSAFTGSNDKYYPINKKLRKDSLLSDLILVLKNVFSFNEEEAKVVVSNYLKNLN